MTFEGKAVLVTGGTRGIGKAIARRFAELGASRLALGYLRNDDAEPSRRGRVAAQTEPLAFECELAQVVGEDPRVVAERARVRSPARAIGSRASSFG